MTARKRVEAIIVVDNPENFSGDLSRHFTFNDKIRALVSPEHWPSRNQSVLEITSICQNGDVDGVHYTFADLIEFN
jgi:hypothetical protein